MMNYRFQKVILVARKILAVGVALTAPLLLKLASDYATLERRYSGALGGEVFVPISVVLLGYLIYPKYDIILEEEDKKDELVLFIKDELGKIHRIKLTKRS